MMNGWGLPIPGHEYLTFYQMMMLRISTGWSQSRLGWSVWQAMLLIREHFWCYQTDNCIRSSVLYDLPTTRHWTKTGIQQPQWEPLQPHSTATLHRLFKNHPQIFFWNNLMPTILFYWMTKVLSNITFGDSDKSGPAPAVTELNFLVQIFPFFNSNI